MIINREFILSRMNYLIESKRVDSSREQKESIELYRIKLIFPKWIRDILFSPFNPIFSIYKQRKEQIKARNTGSYTPLHPFCIDFMKYCFEQDISFDTSIYFSKDDDPDLLSFIDSRIKCCIAGYAVQGLSRIQIEDSNSSKKLLSKVNRRGSFYELVLPENKYFLPHVAGSIGSPYSNSVFTYKYGLKELPVSLLEYIKGKDFLDIGALYGDSAIMFMQYKPSKIYAYEPVKDNFKYLEKTVSRNKLADKVCIINKALGDREGVVTISQAGCASSINTNVSTIANTESIETSTIDNECVDRKIGLIKMDVEGFEYYVIKGGLTTIKRDKPVLLISIYHTGKDFFEIPPLIQSIESSYTFKYLDLAPRDLVAEKIIVCYCV